MRVVLHLFFDNLFFDNRYQLYEQFEGYENRYLLMNICPSGHYDFRMIKNREKIIIAKTEEEWGRVISQSDIDVVVIYGLWKYVLPAYKYIPQRAKVIWWAFGKDLYEPINAPTSLLQIPVLKNETARFKNSVRVNKNEGKGKCLKFNPFLRIYSTYKKREKFKMRERMIKRIDYCATPLPIEYEELRKIPYFHAKPFPHGIGFAKPEEAVYHVKKGSLLFEHSAYYACNHLDIFKSMINIDLSDRTVYFPINYGVQAVKEKVREYAGFNGANTVFLDSIMSQKDYFEMMNSCSHAIFGNLRQQALGNMNACLKKGIKIFLYKDSMNYKYYKQMGYIIFSIEEELNQMEIDTPLTKEEAVHNANLFFSLAKCTSVEERLPCLQRQFDNLFEE